MAAIENNTNALKWTDESVSEILERIENDTLLTPLYFIGSAMNRQRLSRHVWRYWRKKFKHQEEIMERMDLIEELFESNIFEAGIRGEVNTALAIFALKNNHHWSERPAIEVVKEEPYHEGAIIELSNNETIVIPAFKPLKD